MDFAEMTASKDKLCLNAASNYMHMKVTPDISVGLSPKWDSVCQIVQVFILGCFLSLFTFGQCFAFRNQKSQPFA